MRENGKYAREVAKELVDAKRKNMENGELGRDVLSLLGECFWECRRTAHQMAHRFFEQ